jgi:hypothetical protein
VQGASDDGPIRADADLIADEAYRTGDERHVKRLCEEAASRHDCSKIDIFRLAQSVYNAKYG